MGADGRPEWLDPRAAHVYAADVGGDGAGAACLGRDVFKSGGLDAGAGDGLLKATVAVRNTRGIGKADMRLNATTPEIEVDPETYEVHANGELLACQPATELPLAQRYFLF